MRRLRQASWEEVLQLFHGRRHRAVHNAQGWADRYRVPWERYDRLSVDLMALTHSEIGEALDEAAKVEPRIADDWHREINNATLPPRVDGLPIALIVFPNAKKLGFLDGKHRAHRWRHVPGEYAVLMAKSNVG